MLLFAQTNYAQTEPVQTSGDIVLFALPIAAVGTTFIHKDKKGTWQFVKGFLVNGVVTYSLKLWLEIWNTCLCAF